jgi:signal transduction histidine kinase
LLLLGDDTRHNLRNLRIAEKGYQHFLSEPCTEQEREKYLQQLKAIDLRVEAQLEFWKMCEAGGYENSWQSLGSIFNYCKDFSPDITVKACDGMGKIKIYASPLILKVLENLIDNARKHGKNVTEIKIDYAIEVFGNLLIIVEDNGDGIEYEKKPYIFDRGFGDGTGLGLFIIREILDITDIKIIENGKPGKGARFEITVPKNHFKL